MSLTNQQYDTILRQYDRRQLQNKYELDLRREHAYLTIPELSDLDDELATLSVSRAKAALISGSALTGISENAVRISELRRKLLTDNGFPEDYLELHYTCNLCKDTGFTNDQKCRCFEQAVVDLLYAQSNVRNAIKTENFDTFSYEYYSSDRTEPTTGLTPLANIKNVVTSIKNFIINFDKTYSNLLIYGSTGVGKTFLSNCIANELLSTAHTVIYLTAFQLFEYLEHCTFKTAGENTSVKDYDYLLDCDLLIIDDLGTELVNAFTTSSLYLCINERHLRCKSTIISTNLSFAQLQASYSERLFSRITANYEMLKIFGEDIRLKKAFVK